MTNGYSFKLFQVLGYTPDFVSAAMAPYIKDIHRKGMLLFAWVSMLIKLTCLDELCMASVTINIYFLYRHFAVL